MGKSVNKVVILGRLGKDPVIRSTSGGTNVANFSVATESNYKDKTGQWQKTTEWHDCVAWSKLAEVVRQYVAKGSQIYLEGKLSTRSWDDKESGQKRYKTEIVVAEICLLSAKQEGRQQAATQQDEGFYDEDAPF